MLARYNDYIVRARLEGDFVRIWSFSSLQDFSPKMTLSGNFVYEKKVSFSDVDEIFDIGFSVKWNGHWFGCDYLIKSDKIRLFTGDGDLIEKYHFEEFERMAWHLYVEVDTCEKFRVTYTKYPSKEQERTYVSAEEWKNLWRELVIEQLPPQ